MDTTKIESFAIVTRNINFIKLTDQIKYVIISLFLSSFYSLSIYVELDLTNFLGY
jgi:hypothetical protein